jgi:hypothetical protein
MSDDIFDFGFSAVDIDELDVLLEAKAEVENKGAVAGAIEEKLDNLYSAIQPLLNNLKSDPSRDYIFWPDRLEKIEEFEAHLYKIYKG